MTDYLYIVKYIVFFFGTRANVVCCVVYAYVCARKFIANNVEFFYNKYMNGLLTDGYYMTTGNGRELT
jgi:hypothetical protein